MVGFKDPNIKFDFPDKIPLKKTMSDIFNTQCDKQIGFTIRVGGRGSKIAMKQLGNSVAINAVSMLVMLLKVWLNISHELLF